MDAVKEPDRPGGWQTRDKGGPCWARSEGGEGKRDTALKWAAAWREADRLDASSPHSFGPPPQLSHPGLFRSARLPFLLLLHHLPLLLLFRPTQPSFWCT